MEVLNPRSTHRGPIGPEFAGQLLDRARAAKVHLMESGTHGEDAAPPMEELRALAGSLHHLDPHVRLADRSVALAFWVNVYNALVIHGALTFGARKSVNEVKGFFRRAAYRIGAHAFSLDVIEHGILRENRGHPARLFLPQLAPWDDRRALVIRPMDIRIHFALNCGAASCPPIRHYTAENIEAELDLAAGSFLAGGGVRIDPSTGKVHLSRLFLWFWRDFGLGKHKQLDCACGCSSNCFDRPTREKVFTAARSRGIVYDDYDWTLA